MIVSFHWIFCYICFVKEYIIMNGFNEKGERHGPCEVYLSNGKLWYKGTYVNGERHGLFEEYWHNGNLWYKGNYFNGKMHGFNLWYNYNTNGELNIKQYYL